MFEIKLVYIILFLFFFFLLNDYFCFCDINIKQLYIYTLYSNYVKNIIYIYTIIN